MLQEISENLPVGRLRRGLGESTALRNLGVSVGHSMLALESTVKGLSKLELDDKRIDVDLKDNWQVLAEAVQTVMRRHGVKWAYEELGKLMRGGATRDEFRAFIEALEIPEEAKRRLLEMTPANYTGRAAEAAAKWSAGAGKRG